MVRRVSSLFFLLWNSQERNRPPRWPKSKSSPTIRRIPHSGQAHQLTTVTKFPDPKKKKNKGEEGLDPMRLGLIRMSASRTHEIGKIRKTPFIAWHNTTHLIDTTSRPNRRKLHFLVALDNSATVWQYLQKKKMQWYSYPFLPVEIRGKFDNWTWEVKIS